MTWRKVIAVMLGLCIGAVGIYGGAYYQEKARLHPVMSSYQKELNANKAEFKKAVEEIQKEVADGRITQTQGSALMQQELKKSLQKNQEALQQTMDAIVKN